MYSPTCLKWVLVLCVVLDDGMIKVLFIIARNRVAPLKQLSIPRLELQAAVLDVRLCCVVKQELTVNIKYTIFLE